MERIRDGEGEHGEPMDGVHLELVAGGDRMRAQRFEVAPGTVVPEHSHDNEQVGLVTEGTLTFLVDGEEIAVGPGDSFALPSGEPHGAENRGEEPARGVEMFSPPRENPSWESD